MDFEQPLLYDVANLTRSRSRADLFSRSTCFCVHCFGLLSGRQRRNFVPWRNRPPVKWSNCTSATSLPSSGCHSAERFELQRLGPPGLLPVKPGGLISFFSLRVSAGLSFALMDEVNPT